MSKSTNTPTTSKDKDNEEAKQLLARLKKLEEEDKELDKQLEDFAEAGVKEDDTITIMNALHEYNEVRDAVYTILGHLSSLTKTPVTKLLDKYNIPKTMHATRIQLKTTEDKLDNEKFADGKYEDEKFTHFGFETVTESEKTKKVHDVFASVANTYDTMNDLMSLGIHRIWKDIFVSRLGPTVNTQLLDVAGGTGDIAFRYLRYLSNLPNIHTEDLITTGSHVTVCDINENMLKVGEERARAENLHPELIDFQVGNAEELPFAEAEFSAYTIAFGMRNVTRIDKALSEAYRVLKPGGRFMCLEFSSIQEGPAKWLYDQYSFQIIPIMGQIIAGQWQPYQYLVESIRKFPNQDDYATMLQTAGFRHVFYENLSLGMVAIHSGFKI